VTDALVVVTVTYSPGPHHGRFPASLPRAIERPVAVAVADST
jgi:N-acetylglucosaminyl-diphospho-decaprenol L-rhamnosyltransferase